ncbi:MAG: hypothetical protein ACJ8CR_03945 [Roseiflexaceae bacterium]
MSAEDIKRNQELIEILKRRKHIRERQLAQLGITADPSVHIEIEDINKTIVRLEQEIEAIKKSVVDDKDENAAENNLINKSSDDEIKHKATYNGYGGDILLDLSCKIEEDRGFRFGYYSYQQKALGEFGYFGTKIVNRLIYSVALVMADNFDFNDFSLTKKTYIQLVSRTLLSSKNTSMKHYGLLCYVFEWGASEEMISSISGSDIFASFFSSQYSRISFDQWIFDVSHGKLHKENLTLNYGVYYAEMDFLSELIQNFIRK